MNMHDDVIKLFVTVGLSEQKAKETVKNDVLTKRLKFVIEEVMFF
jgi:glutaminyl-tRNA synthetase